MLNSQDLQTLNELVLEPMIESRYDCPVCVGLPMEQLKFALSGRSFTLDTCQRCAGVWFDWGEMALAAEAQTAANSDLFHNGMVRIAAKPMQCHDCGMLMGRNLVQCPCCGWKNILDCPICEVKLERRSVGMLAIDCCLSCQGIWLDRVELPALHYLSRSAFTPQVLIEPESFVPHGSRQGRDGETVKFVLEVLSHPDDALNLVQGVASGAAVVVKVSALTVHTIATIIAGLLGS